MKLKPIKAPTADHALLSPSAAKKWLGCPASLACEVGIPNTSGAAAVNGTAMHHLSECVLNAIKDGHQGRDFDVAKFFAPVATDRVVVRNEGKGPMCISKDAQPGDVVVTDDFVTQVSKYVNYCAPIMAAAEVVEIEAKVSLTRILHPGFEIDCAPLQTFGTADFVALMPHVSSVPGHGYTLIVGDLKTGRHKVTAAENKQMMLYALGLLRKYSRTYDISAVKLFIFQPYAGGADEWDTTPAALEHFGKFASKQAVKALDAYQRGKKGLTPADFRPSNDACQWCRFSEQCNAKTKAASHTMDELMDLGGIEMTPAVLKAEWDKLPLMRKHIDDIEKAMYASLMRGDKVEGLKLVEGRPGNRAWSDTTAVEEFVAMNGDMKDVMYKQSLLSPTEAEKALKGEWSTSLDALQRFVTRKPGQPSIAAADDKRPAWTPVTDGDLA